MASEITMPKLSDTMTEGLFAGWKKNIGDRIERGDIIAEVETDKAVMELEAFASGILIRTMVHGGENVPVGTVLGLIGTAEELEQPAADSRPISTPPPETGAGAAASVSQPATTQPAEPQPAEFHGEKASPLVRRLAREQGLDLELVTGSGPEGRITQDDLAMFTRKQPEITGAAAPLGAPPEGTQASSPAGGAMTPMRQAIADTVTRSWQTIPHFSVTAEIDMDACREIVNELREGGTPVSYSSLVIKACAGALQKFPLLNAATPDSSGDIHISFAVSKPDGLLMPVIRGCQRLSVAGIEAEFSRLVEKSRSGRLMSEEMAGGTFSVSNLGMYGIDQFTALIMPGQTAILAVGAVRERPVVRDGGLVAAATMHVTISCDHRRVDGAYAASFMVELRSGLENPVRLLMQPGTAL